MFSYFNTIKVYNTDVKDIWKKLTFEIELEDYQLYQIIDGDNLMNISYKFYNTINDWWVIYLFNGLNNINFDLLQSKVLDETIVKHKELVYNYNTISTKDKKYIETVVREYYLVDFELKEAIQKSILFLEVLNPDDIEDFIIYVQDDILINSFYNKELKIPNTDTVMKIKNKMEDLSEFWIEHSK